MPSWSRRTLPARLAGSPSAPNALSSEVTAVWTSARVSATDAFWPTVSPSPATCVKNPALRSVVRTWTWSRICAHCGVVAHHGEVFRAPTRGSIVAMAPSACSASGRSPGPERRAWSTAGAVAESCFNRGRNWSTCCPAVWAWSRIPVSGVRAVRSVVSSWARPPASWSAPPVSLARSSLRALPSSTAPAILSPICPFCQPSWACSRRVPAGRVTPETFVTPGTCAMRDAISSRSASPLPVRMSVGDSTTRNSEMTTSLRKCRSNSWYPLVAGGGVGLSFAVVVAQRDRRGDR